MLGYIVIENYLRLSFYPVLKALQLQEHYPNKAEKYYYCAAISCQCSQGPVRISVIIKPAAKANLTLHEGYLLGI